MPAPQIARLARVYKTSAATVEKYWDECKAGIKPKQGKDGYGLVVNCVKAKLRKRKG